VAFRFRNSMPFAVGTGKTFSVWARSVVAIREEDMMAFDQ
jgi:hypothetical protein